MSATFSSRSKKTRCKRWDVVDTPSIEEIEALSSEQVASLSLPEGFCIRFFKHDMFNMFTVGSKYVYITRGVLDYLQDYNQIGPNKSRNKLFLCTQFNGHQSCPNGPLCREVHCTLSVDDACDASVYRVPSNATGTPNAVHDIEASEILLRKLNGNFGNNNNNNGGSNPNISVDEDAAQASCSALPPSTDTYSPIYFPIGMVLRHSLHTRWTSQDMYPPLPPGILFKIALPNTPIPVDAYDSGELLVTKGAQEYYDQCIRQEPVGVTMQHCAHFSKNGICCFGEDCQFVHVRHYKIRDRTDADASMSDCCDGTPLTGESRRVKSKRPSSAKETPLSYEDSYTNLACSLVSVGSSNNSRSSSAGNRSVGKSGSIHHVRQQSANQLTSAVPLSAVGSNCVLVPASTASWQAQPPQQPQHYTQPMIYSSMPQAAAPVTQGTYMMMPVPQTEYFVVPQSAQGAPHTMQTQQPIYMMPVTYQK